MICAHIYGIHLRACEGNFYVSTTGRNIDNYLA